MVIPAHNEEAVIGRCLGSLSADSEPGEIEVVVVCNGCTDGTADAARSAWPSAKVVEIPKASKIDALNTGDATTEAFPRFYVDADIEVGATSLRTVAATMETTGVDCAAPRPVFVLDGRPWSIRAFYEVWESLPYLNDQVVGSGVYGLSRAGRARFDAFPDLTADDQFVLQLFSSEERLNVADASFRVHPPTRLRGLYQMRRRVYRSMPELANAGLDLQPVEGRRVRSLLGLLGRPRMAPAVALYATVNALAMARSRLGGSNHGWERDTSARWHDRPGTSSPRIGYVVSRYPSISHTFVLREVLAARAAGLEVSTFSVKRSDPGELLSEIDREEADRTWSVRPVAAAVVVREHLATLRRHPRAWATTMVKALRHAPPGPRALLWQMFYFAEAVLLWRECERRSITHLHAHMANVAADLAWLASEFGRAADQSSGWRWTMTMHGSTEFSEVTRFNLAAKVESADLVICVSEFTRSQMMAVSKPADWAKLVAVHTGTDLRRYHPTGRAHSDDEPLRVLTVGRLHPVKGFSLLIEAVADLHGQGERVTLTLVGDGPLHGELSALAKRLGVDHIVDFAGAVGQDALASYYRDADVFCLPSFNEGVPVVLMEAMASGLPVVSSRITGIPELVEDGVSGLLVVPGRAALLSEALGELARDPAARKRMGEAGRAKIEAEFDAERCGLAVAAHLGALHGVEIPFAARAPRQQTPA